MALVVRHIVDRFCRLVKEGLHGLYVTDGVVTIFLTRQGRSTNAQEIVDAVGNISERREIHDGLFDL